MPTRTTTLPPKPISPGFVCYTAANGVDTKPIVDALAKLTARPMAHWNLGNKEEPDYTYSMQNIGDASAVDVMADYEPAQPHRLGFHWAKVLNVVDLALCHKNPFCMGVSTFQTDMSQTERQAAEVIIGQLGLTVVVDIYPSSKQVSYVRAEYENWASQRLGLAQSIVTASKRFASPDRQPKLAVAIGLRDRPVKQEKPGVDVHYQSKPLPPDWLGSQVGVVRAFEKTRVPEDNAGTVVWGFGKDDQFIKEDAASLATIGGLLGWEAR